MVPIRLAMCSTILLMNPAVAQLCQPIPEEVEPGKVCSVHTEMEYLAIELVDIGERSLIIQAVIGAMESFGFYRLSENMYWYPEGRSCYFSWYGLDTEDLVLVQSISNVLVDQLGYCGVDSRRYYPVQFAEFVEQELENLDLQDSASIDFTNIEIDSPMYADLLQNGGVPSLMDSNGIIVTVDMHY